MFNPMFTKSHKPIVIGSLLRNTGAGGRISIVTDIQGSVVTVKTYGHTNKGNFQLAQRQKVLTGYLVQCYTGKCETNCMFASIGKASSNMDWHYTHVVRNW